MKYFEAWRSLYVESMRKIQKKLRIECLMIILSIYNATENILIHIEMNYMFLSLKFLRFLHLCVLSRSSF